MKRQIKLLTIFLILSILAVAQSDAQSLAFYINGKVIDKESQEPIPLSEIFISGSSVSTATDENGKFKISVPFLPCYLVVTHDKHEPFATYIEDFMDTMNIEMSPPSINASDYPTLTKSERKKEVRFFIQQFVGNDTQTSYDILNESVLYFTHEEMKFQAKSIMPLVIINKHLGYKIRVLLREFEITKRDEMTLDETPLSSYSGYFVRKIMGHFYYEPIDYGSESQLKKYEKNRQNYYYGSYRHFLKALYDGKIMENGYQLTFYPTEAIRNGISFTNLSTVKQSPSKIKICMMSADSLKVDFHKDSNGLPIDLTKSGNTFTKETSVFFPSRVSLRIRPNGTCPNIPYEIKGPMSEYYFIGNLPDDYEPGAPIKK